MYSLLPSQAQFACLLSLLLFGPLGTSANAAETVEGVQQKIQKTSKRLQQLDAEINNGRQLKQKLSQALSNTELRVGERKQRLDSLGQDIAAYNQKLLNLEALLAQERNGVEQTRQSLAVSLRKMQRVSAVSGLKVVLQHDDPSLADRLNVYTGYFLRAQRRAINTQTTILAKLEAASAEALKNRNWLHYIKRKASGQYQARLAERSVKRQSLGEIETLLTSKNRTVAQLKADQQRLATLMSELEAAQVAQSGYFIAGQGQYPLPVDGQVEAHFGDLKSVGRLHWNGIFIRSRPGTLVRSIADGEVVYSDYLQGLGMLVIIDHGDGFMTLYGGNRDLVVSPGAWVESGASIATVGDSGGQSSSGVYFEVRHNAKPVDPEKWVSSKNGVKSAKK